MEKENQILLIVLGGISFVSLIGAVLYNIYLNA